VGSHAARMQGESLARERAVLCCAALASGCTRCWCGYSCCKPHLAACEASGHCPSAAGPACGTTALPSGCWIRGDCAMQDLEKEASKAQDVLAMVPPVRQVVE